VTRLGLRFRLGQDAPAAGDHRIRRQNEAAGMARRDNDGFFGRQTQGVLIRQFAFQGSLVDVGGVDQPGFDADLPEKIEPTRRRRGEDEPVGQFRAYAAIRIIRDRPI
jgi:hypothetical protein